MKIHNLCYFAVPEYPEEDTPKSYNIILLHEGDQIDEIKDVSTSAEEAGEIAGKLNRTHTLPINWKDAVIDEINRLAAQL